MKMAPAKMRENSACSWAGKEERCGEQEYLESHGEVHQVEVEVVQLEGSKALLEPYLHQGLLMEGVPQLWEETKPDCHFTGQTRAQKLLTWRSGRRTPSPLKSVHAEDEDETFHC